MKEGKRKERNKKNRGRKFKKWVQKKKKQKRRKTKKERDWMRKKELTIELMNEWRKELSDITNIDKEKKEEEEKLNKDL